MDEQLQKVKKEIDKLIFKERKEVREAMLSNGDRKAWEKMIIRRNLVIPVKRVKSRKRRRMNDEPPQTIKTFCPNCHNVTEQEYMSGGYYLCSNCGAENPYAMDEEE